MKTQKYLVTIEMPDGDHIGPGWIRDVIQDDCDVEDKGRQIVSVEEYGDVDWGEYHREAVKDILCHILLTDKKELLGDNVKFRVRIAHIYADELIRQIKEESK